ncbi:hypothetical protein [Oceanobacillus timonensis]|uniref:hypothetical protein n=1 Tax=Oceanobacillus timonensis TaxID=1926285 RepID=UPI0009BBBE05|nr:hypothetical protein [Oceanobacillus timonensis]
MKDIIFSEWQFVTVFFTMIAVLAMIIGRYPRKTTFISGILAFFFNLAAVSFLIYLNTFPDQSQPDATSTSREEEEVDIEDRLNEVYEDNKYRTANKELVAIVEPINENGNMTSHVYVKNFHQTWAFHGEVRVAIYDENNEIIHEEIFDISLDSGETKQIDSDFGNPHFDWFRYAFYPEEN